MNPSSGTSLKEGCGQGVGEQAQQRTLTDTES